MAANKNIIVNLPGDRVKYIPEPDEEPIDDVIGTNGAIMIINCELPDAEGTYYAVNIEIINPLTGSKLAPMSADDVIIENGKVKLLLYEV